MSVIIVGEEEFPEHELLADAVANFDVPVTYYDATEWPDVPPLTYWPGVDVARDSERDGAPAETDDVIGVYAPIYDLIDPKFDSDFDDYFAENWRRTYAVQQDHRWAVLNYLRMLERVGVTVVPGFDAQFVHDSSAWQLQLFADHGLPVPETVVTDDPDVVEAFYDNHDRVLYKPVVTRMPPKELTDDDLTPERLAKVTTAPVVFQQFVPGRDLRIYVVDGEIRGGFHYQSDRISFKWSLVDGETVPVEQVSLSESIRETARRATALTGLQFAAVDVIDRPDGGHAILEVNPSPRFSVPETETDASIASAVARLLVGE